MAKWINFPVVNGHDGGGAVPAEDGDNLLLADSILSIAVAEGAPGTAVTATLTLVDSKVCTVLIGLNADASDPGAAAAKPASTGYLGRFKKAINLAITANPGGVKSTVSLPQDTVPQGSYDQDKTVYFKSFKVA
tara:strand:+ start:248 stop:649 length:402 start_codon:yes stop_codon:yes gene_type:complete